MPVQDLTPQLRTRLNRLEKLVGVFVTTAALLLLAGLAYYTYHTANRKGWFVTKAPYFVYLRGGAGLKVGDTVRLMGFPAGEITEITAAPPFTYDDEGNMLDVYVKFVVHDPFYGYIWSDSTVKVKSAGLLGDRFLEVTKGGSSGTTNKLFATYQYKQTQPHELTHILIRPTRSNPIPGGVYSNGLTAANNGLRTAVNLAGADVPVLRFRDRFSLAVNDYGFLEVSPDGGSWTRLYCAQGGQTNWAEHEVCLIQWKGQANLRIRFYLSTDGAGTELDLARGESCR